MSTIRSQSLQPQTAKFVWSARRVFSTTDPTNQSSTIIPPPSVPTGESSEPNYLPFFFGAEFELILRPNANLAQEIQVPDFDASHRQNRDFNLRLLEVIAGVLTDAGLPCDVYDSNSDFKPDYSKWNATLDSSLSKKHMKDQFYPVEIVTPKIQADSNWPGVIDHFWSVLTANFEFRQEFSCGFHVHISSASQAYSMNQLRQMAKAVVIWEPSTARCAPPSRQDRIIAMCNSNLSSKDTLIGADLHRLGPWRGLTHAFSYIDQASRDDIVKYVCPDKYRAWNFNPCKTSGFGSIEFRRAPGVVNAKKAKHWIAFVIAFVKMAIQFNPSSFAESVEEASALQHLGFPKFEAQLLRCAKSVGVFAQLDPRLRQPDNPRNLHITVMSEESLQYLQEIDPDYHLSGNC